MSIGKTALLILALAISEFSAGGTARAQEALPANAKAQNLGPLAYTLDARLIPAVNAVRAAASTDAQAALDIKSAHGRALAPTAQAEHLAIRIDAPVNDALLAQIRAAGAVVTHSAPQWNTVCATATVSQIDALTRIEAVRSIMLQAGKRRHQQGSTANQGDGVMNADKVRATFGVTGKGQKIGVISDSVTDTSAVRGNSYKVSGSVPNAAVTGTVPQGTGDLPPSFQVVDFGPGQGTDEGELIMEVIYDVAPGAALAFASAGNDQTAMASNLLALRTEANCTITVDDIAFFDEPFFQDGPIAQAVTTNFNASVLLFSAIGNDGANGILTTYNPINSTVDDLQDPPSGNCFHNWGIGTATPSFLPIFLPAGDELIVILQWNQPYQSYGLGSGSQADLDLYLYATNSTSGRVLSKSATPQGKAGSPSGDPYEIIDYVNMGGDRTVYLALNHYQGVRGNVMRLVVSDVSGGTLSFPAGGVNGISAYGHPTTQACIGVGAIFWQDAQNNILRPESYSSEGGMGAAGVPYYFDTSGKALAGAPVTVSTPLIVAPDGVDTSLQTDFLGTSCAAPNAAAVAALLLQAAPGTSPAKLTAVLKSSATDCTAAPASPGPDAFTGWGLINALAAAQALSVASPAPSITSSNTAGGTVGQAFNYQITASNSPTSYGAAPLPSGLSVNSSTGAITGTPTAAGTASVTISATNATGTGSATLSLTINANTAAPVISSATSAGGTAGQAFSYQITASNSPTSYSAANLPPGLFVNTSTGAITGTPTAGGTASVTISATNAAGTGSATLAITITMAPPVISSSTSAGGTTGQAFNYQITASSSPTNYNAAPLPAGLSLNANTGAITGIPTTAGTTSATVSATNAAGTGSGTLTITIVNPQTGVPLITSLTTTSGNVAVAFSYNITASNTPTSYNATPLPDGLAVNAGTGAITGIPTTVGTLNTSISATNANGTGTANLVITIKAALPVITSPTAATGTVGVAFSYTIQAANNPTSYGATGLPAGLSFSGQVISGTPGLAGTSSVALSATNASGTGSATLSLTINNPPPPVITSSAAATGTIKQAFSYQIQASNLPTSYNATGLPAGLSVDNTSGAISGTPGTLGLFNVTVSATNTSGTGSATLALTINPSAPPSVGAISASPNPAMTGMAVSFSVTASQPDGQALNLAWDFKDGSPAASGSSLTHTYSVAVDTTFTVTLTVSDGVTSPVTRTLDLTVYAPASGGSGQPTPNVGATAADPLDGTSVTVASSDGGVVQLVVSLDGGAVPSGYTVTTSCQDAAGNNVGAQVQGTQPIFKFTAPGLYLLQVKLYDGGGSVVGLTGLALPISAAETGSTAAATPPASLAITAVTLKGKFLFSATKPDTVSFKGAFVLPGNLDLSQRQTFQAALGNVTDEVSLNTKGQAKVGVQNLLKNVTVKYPRLKKPATATSPGQKTTVSFTLSATNLDLEGFFTEGITNDSRIPLGKSVPRTVQAALFFGGTAYRADIPSTFKLAKNGKSALLANNPH